MFFMMFVPLLHCYGYLYNPFTTPELAKAAETSLKSRGKGDKGWCKAWRMALWARLHNGNKGYWILRDLVSNNLYPNLFDSHPPFQIDGNFGYAAAVIEMLVQSHNRIKTTDKNHSPWLIHLLPALPDTWSKGEVKGLRARGNIGVDISWTDGKLTEAVLTAERGRKISVLYGSSQKLLTIPRNGRLTVTPEHL
ncbi:glycoside hydrolase family 95-like protein [Verrucomicrobiota bacterium]